MKPIHTKIFFSILGLVLIALGSSALPKVGLADLNPYILLNNYLGKPESSLTATGFGFGSNEKVKVELKSRSTDVNTDANGNFDNASLSVPQESAGNHEVTATGNNTREKANANFYIQGFYPKAKPSAFYILPNQFLGFSGTDFAPNETILITDSGGTRVQTTADANGNFSALNTVKIPFDWQESNRTFTAKGSVSGLEIPMTIVIGTFYPQISPSTYFISSGEILTVNGEHFAPYERVLLFANGNPSAEGIADGSGNIQWSFVVPNITNETFTITGQGLFSGRSSVRTITIAH